MGRLVDYITKKPQISLKLFVVAKQVELSNQYIEDFLAIIKVYNWIQLRIKCELG